MRDAALALALATAVVTALLAYRLYCQISGAMPIEGPGRWIYSAAGRLVDPFRAAETVDPVNDAAYFELAALVALEVYLAAGAAAAVLLWTAAGLVADARLPAVNRALGAAIRACGRGATAAADAAAGAAYALAAGAAAYLRSRDWAGYRDAAYAASERALVASRRHGVAVLHLMARDASSASMEVAEAGEARLRVAAAEARESWARALPEFGLLLSSLDGTAKSAFEDVGAATRSALASAFALGLAVAAFGHVSPRVAAGRRLSRREFFLRLQH
jgi:hypothetical protein